MSVMRFKSNDECSSCMPGRAGLPGPGGAVGATGPTGYTGPVGATGTDGTAGSAVNTGATGQTGPTGPTGMTGAAGSAANTGPTGPGVSGTQDELAYFDTATSIASAGTGFNIKASGPMASNYIGIGNGLIEVGLNSIAIGSVTNAAGATSVAIGNGAKTLGVRSISVGSDAGSNLPASSDDNIAIGAQACQGASVVATDNVGIGHQALLTIEGNFNVAIGTAAGAAITTGSSNVCIGNSAGNTITTTDNSIAIGNDAQSLGAGSIAIGKDSKTISGADNTIVIGHNGPATNISGPDNICMGSGAGGASGLGLSGEYNVCIGSDAGSQMTGANENVCVGKWTLQDIVNSHFNVCIGAEAGRVITGANNTCLGMNAGPTTVAGSGNVFLGSSAGIAAHGISSADNSKLVIANGSAAANRLIFGDFATPNVGISTSLPATATNLDVADGGADNKPGQTFKRVSATIDTDDALGTINFSGTADNVNFGTDSAIPRVGASIQGCAAEDWTTGAPNSGSDLRFFTTINGGGGATAFHEMMRISDNGNVAIAHNTTPGFNPVDPNILHVRTTNVDSSIMVETQPLGAGITSSLTLANNPTAGTTLSSTSDPIGAVAVQGVDASVGPPTNVNISQMNTFLTDGTASAFTSNVEFSMMAAGDEVKCMEMRGSDTTTGFLGGDFGNGLLSRTYIKRVGNGTYELSDADSGMHIWASTSGGNVTISITWTRIKRCPAYTHHFLEHIIDLFVIAEITTFFALIHQMVVHLTLKCLVLLHMEEQQCLRRHPSLHSQILVGV